MARRPRGLRPEEQELWDRVARSATPLNPARPTDAEKPPLPAAPPPRNPPAAEKSAPIPSFRLGETAPARGAGHDLAPSVAEHIAGQPVRMDRKAFQRLARGKLTPEARLDLHGMTLAEAHPELIRFVLNAQAQGKRLVLVITGKGRDDDGPGPIPRRRGVLRHQVPHWLTAPPLGAAVLQVATSHRKHGGEGAFYVYLRR